MGDSAVSVSESKDVPENECGVDRLGVLWWHTESFKYRWMVGCAKRHSALHAPLRSSTSKTPAPECNETPLVVFSALASCRAW